MNEIFIVTRDPENFTLSNDERTAPQLEGMILLHIPFKIFCASQASSGNHNFLLHPVIARPTKIMNRTNKIGYILRK